MKKNRWIRWAAVACCLFALLFGGADRAYAFSRSFGSSRTVMMDSGMGRAGNSMSELERKALSNSYGGEYSVELSCGLRENYRDINQVPMTATLFNGNAMEFEGTLVVQMTVNSGAALVDKDQNTIFSKLFPSVQGAGDERDQVFTYRLPVRIPANEKVTKSFSVGVTLGNYTNCSFSLENGYGEAVFHGNRVISPAEFSGAAIYVAVLEEGESGCARQINGGKLESGIYEMEAFSAGTEIISKEMIQARMPDVLVFLDIPYEDLDEKQRELVQTWENQGGFVLDFAGDTVYAESQRAAFRANPERYIEQALDEDTLNHMVNQRDGSSQWYYIVNDLLENMKIRNRPSALLYGILLGVYTVLVGPGLYLILKRMKKQQYLWGGICVCSAVFVFVIGLLGSRTKLKAPVITYLDEIWQYDDTMEENLNLNVQAPYNSSYQIHFDPTYDLVACNSSSYTISTSAPMEEGNLSSGEQIAITYGDQKNVVTLSNMSAFALNPFRMNKRQERPAGEGLTYEFHCFDGRVDGFVENHTGYDLANAVLMMPGYCLKVGSLEEGERKELKDAPIERSQETGRKQDDSGISLSELYYQNYMRYCYVLNRRDDGILAARICDKEEAFQLDSGYEAYGLSFYLARVFVDMEKDGILYCPYAQEYYSKDDWGLGLESGAEYIGMNDRQEEITYYLNNVFERFNVWEEYQDYAANQMAEYQMAEQNTGNDWQLLSAVFWQEASGIYSDRIRQISEGTSGILRGDILSVEFQDAKGTDEYSRMFDGEIEIYNWQTGVYEPLSDRKLNFTRLDMAMERYLVGNRLRVRYTLPEDEEVYLPDGTYYVLPDLVVMAREYPVEDYLKAVFDMPEESYAED